jgi:hypothetical protein
MLMAVTRFLDTLSLWLQWLSEIIMLLLQSLSKFFKPIGFELENAPAFSKTRLNQFRSSEKCTGKALFLIRQTR